MADSTPESTVVIIDDRALPSLFRDLTTFALGTGFIGIGWLLGSGAMQWAGFIVFWITVFARMSGTKKKFERTPQQAADFLLERFGVTGRAKADGAAMEWSTDANGEGWFERDGEAARTKAEEQSS